MTNRLLVPPVPERTVLSDKASLMTQIWSKWMEILRTAIMGNIQAGYGGIAVVAADTMGTVSSTWANITGYDTDLINKPNGVTYDKALDGLTLDREGIWEYTVSITLEFDEENFGRRIKARGFNVTKGDAGQEFIFFVGRNQGGVNIDVSLINENGVGTIGDLIVIQIQGPIDDFNNTVNIGTRFQVINIAERSFSG